MSTENHTNAAAPITASSPSRRTVIKAGAWSVPVIAAAVATPLAAASTTTEVDIAIGHIQAGDGFTATSPDGTRAVEYSLSLGAIATVSGTEPVNNAILTMQYDARLHPGTPTVGEPGNYIDAATVSTTVNLTTATFVIPTIPANGGERWLAHQWDQQGTRAWYEDIHPVTMTVTPPSGITDPNLGNNSITSSVRYYDVTDNDAALSVVWEEVSRPDPFGEPIRFNNPVAATIASLGTDPVPSGTSLTVWMRDGVLADVTVTSAVLDGADVSSSIGTPTKSGPTWSIPVNTEIPAGQSLVLDLGSQLPSTVPSGFTNSCELNIDNVADTNSDNNGVTAPAL